MSTSVNAQAPNSPVILLVEDESIVREVTGEVLSHAGYQVLESGNAKEALRIAGDHQGKIDVLLTDIVMPEMNGADLAHHMLNQQPDLITIFMSGYAEQDLLRKTKLSSAIHIQKPFTVNALLTRVSEALNAVAEQASKLPDVSV
jgi:two-component system, cell cycle sensor histidine kinase and response regulator CckA